MDNDCDRDPPPTIKYLLVIYVFMFEEDKSRHNQIILNGVDRLVKRTIHQRQFDACIKSRTVIVSKNLFEK